MRYEKDLTWKKLMELTAQMQEMLEDTKEKWLKDRLLGAALSAHKKTEKAIDLPWRNTKIAWFGYVKEEILKIRSLLILAEKMRAVDAAKARELQEACITINKIIGGFQKFLRKPKESAEAA